MLEKNPYLSVCRTDEIRTYTGPIHYHAMQIDRVLAEAIEKPIIGNNEPRKALKYTAAEAD